MTGINQQAQAAQAAARQKTGEFGTQDHADPGVIAPASDRSPDPVAAALEQMGTVVHDFGALLLQVDVGTKLEVLCTPYPKGPGYQLETYLDGPSGVVRAQLPAKADWYSPEMVEEVRAAIQQHTVPRFADYRGIRRIMLVRAPAGTVGSVFFSKPVPDDHECVASCYRTGASDGHAHTICDYGHLVAMLTGRKSSYTGMSYEAILNTLPTNAPFNVVPSTEGM